MNDDAGQTTAPATSPDPSSSSQVTPVTSPTVSPADTQIASQLYPIDLLAQPVTIGIQLLPGGNKDERKAIIGVRVDWSGPLIQSTTLAFYELPPVAQELLERLEKELPAMAEQAADAARKKAASHTTTTPVTPSKPTQTAARAASKTAAMTPDKPAQKTKKKPTSLADAPEGDAPASSIRPSAQAAAQATTPSAAGAPPAAPKMQLTMEQMFQQAQAARGVK